MKPIIPFALLGALFAIGAAKAAVTVPVGYNTSTLYGSVGGNRTNNVVAPQLINPASFAGTVASVSGDQIFLPAAALTPNAFNEVTFDQPRYTYYIQAADGTWAHIESNDATSVTVEAGMGSQFVATDVITIRRHFTIADMFGATNTAGLTPDNTGDATFADQIILIDEQYGGNVIIFPSTVLGGNWITDAVSFDAADFPIYLDQGMQVLRIGAADLSLVVDGEVDIVGRQNGIPTGLSVRPNAIPVDSTLDELNLYTGNFATGLADDGGSGDVGEADTVNVLTDGTTAVYYYSLLDLGSGPGWYDDGGVFKGDFVLPAGSALIINRDNDVNSSPFTWDAPGATVAP